jgi:formylglycine-generating enzyme
MPPIDFHMLNVPGETYQIGQYEVTYQEWSTVYAWATTNGYTFANTGLCGSTGTGSSSQPVAAVNWRDCMVFCNAASEYNGLTPVYYTDSGYTILLRTSTNSGTTNTAFGSEDNPYVNAAATGYRLPGSNEWYVAARYPATPDDYASGATANWQDDAACAAVAVFAYYYGGGTYPATGVTGTASVGTKNPNTIGAYDMSGNLWEWCFEWYPGYEGICRVIRGGSWWSYSVQLQVCGMQDGNPCDAVVWIGFRLARTLP